MKELIEELEKKKENQEVVVIDYMLDKLKSINIFFEIARAEVECAIEDLCNDDLWGQYAEQLNNLSKSDINTLAWKVEDMDVWDDIYETARGVVLEEIDEEEYE